MANRLNVRNFQTLEKGPVALYLRAAIGATGAPTINAAQSKGFYAITRTGVGAYTIKLGLSASKVDTYLRLMSLQHVIVGASSTAVGVVVVADNSAVGAAPTILVQFVSAPATPVELGSGEDLRISMVFSNSSGM